MRTPSRVAIACAMLAGAIAGASACGAPAQGDAAERGSAAAQSSTDERAFGDQYTFHNGLTVRVSRPTSFTPSKTAYPNAYRAIAFEIVIVNGTEWPYHLSDLSITTSIGGEESAELIDTTQGYNGIVDISAEVPVASKTRMTLAYVAPRQPDDIRLAFRPDPDTTATAIFVGRVQPVVSGP